MLAAAAEGEDLIDQRLPALTCGHHLLHIAPGLAAGRRQRRQGHFAIANDRTQDVVEVMGNAAGQGADRLHALRLPQLGLEGLSLGLGPLALQRVGEDFADRAQQRDVVVGPALPRLNRIESEQTDPPARTPHGKAKPGADAALREGDLLRARWQLADRGNMNRSLLDEALEPRRPCCWQIPTACHRRLDAGTTPCVRSVVAFPVGVEQEDVGAIDAGVLAKLHERLNDALVDPVGR